MSAPKFQMLRPREDAAPREVPWSEEAEQHVIACCLIDNGETVRRALRAGVTEKAFHAARNLTLWTTIVELFRARQPVTLETLIEELKTRRELEGVTLGYLMDVTGRTQTTTQAGYFIEKVMEKSALRLVVRVGTEAVEKAYSYTGGELDGVFAEQLTALSAAVKHARRGNGPVLLSEQIDEVVKDTTAAVEGRVDKSGWIYTGLPTFDERFMPMGSQRVDHLVVDAAGSGIGKSAFMRQVAGHTLERGQRVRAYSREDGIEGFIELLAASRAAADLKHRERWDRMTLQKFVAECAKLRELADKRLWVVENTPATPLLTIEELADDARDFAATQGAPHLWIVDYLQLFGSKRRFASREQEVAHVSHTLQGLVGELGGVWLVGCQMNEKGLAEMRAVRRERTSDGKEGKVIHRVPHAGDLRESQAIYHDAHRVVAHYLPPVDSRDQDQTGPNIEKPEVWLCQIKRKKGGTGIVKTWFEKRFTRFVELPAFTHGGAAGGTPGATKQQFKGEKRG